MRILLLYVQAYLLTFVIEYTVAWLFRVRGREGFLLVAAVNLITNPAAMFANMFLGSLSNPLISGTDGTAIRHLLIETAVVITEALLYKRYAEGFPFPWRLSAAANGISYLSGLILQHILFF